MFELSSGQFWESFQGIIVFCLWLLDNLNVILPHEHNDKV